ncbi:acyltransferase [Deinococcus sp. 23YEL01]|nr:acyltransferase [Deinococcus sp. 23YEL01]
MTHIPTPRSATRGVSYDFVNSIRFISIALIVLGHSSSVVGHEFMGSNMVASTLFYSLQKFDIICMYLVSGFLMGDAANRSKEYVMRRVNRTFSPWLIWAGVMTVITILSFIVNATPLAELPAAIYHLITRTSYWFIPNYIFSLMFMFFVLRYVPRKLSGALLLIATLLYGANLYGEWFTTQHTTAWFGFMIYLWVGAYARQNWTTLEPMIRRIDWKWFLASSVLLGVLVALETRFLMTFSDDAANALKFSNHLYSLSCALLLITFPWRIIPKWIDSRRESFGVYLTHSLILVLMYQVTKRLGFTAQGKPEWVAMIMWVLAGSVAYLLSIALVKVLVRMGKGSWVGDTV